MNDVHARAKRGIKFLLGRQIALQCVMFGGGIILARVLGPSQFGIYAIASFLVTTIALVGDFGLAGSLIQRKQDLTELDLRVAFTMQQALTTAIVALLIVFAPWLVRLYPKAPSEMVWLVRALAFNLYVISWRTMSALQLERHLKYDRLAMIEVIEAMIYQLTAVGFAVTGHGVWSYVFAVIGSGSVGTVLVYAASPWKIRPAFDRQVAWRILRFGVPFQIQTIVNALGGWVTPIIVGGLIGPTGVGFLTWASANGKKPTVIVNNAMRVAFPHFSRIQDDRNEVVRTITRYLTWLLIACGLWFAAIAVCSPLLVRILYTAKWVPAVPCLIIYAGSVALDTIVWVVSVSLLSLGVVGLTSKLTFLRNITSIAVGAGLVMTIGIIGVPIAFLLGALVVVPSMLRALGPGRASQILMPQLWILIPTTVSIVCGWLTLGIAMPQLASAVVSLITVAASYCLCATYVAPSMVRKKVRSTGINALRAVGFASLRAG